MSWEVLITMSKTSFFNPTIFKRNTKSYWPIWAILLFILLISLPIMGMNADARSYETHILTTGSILSSVLGFIYAPIAAMAVFSYRYNQRSAGGMASLPVKRETMFLTDTLSIVIWAVGVYFITAIVTILVSIPSAGLSVGNIALVLLQWFITSVLSTLLFIGLAVFCAVLTSNLFVLPCIYGVFNCVVIAFYGLITLVLQLFLYGYDSVMPDAVRWLTPIYMMLAHQYRTGIWNPTYIFAAVGIILILAALLLAKHHRVETASDVVAVEPLKPVARYCAGIAGAFTIGFLIHEIVCPLNNTALAFSICFIIGAFIAYFAAEMLIRKSFKVFDKWPGFAVIALVLIAFFICIDMDVFGYESYVPKTEEITTARLNVNGSGTIVVDEKDELAIVSRIHHAMTDEYIEQVSRSEDEEIDYSTYGVVDIEYRLNNGRTVSRQYGGVLPWEYINALYNNVEKRKERLEIPEGCTLENYFTGWAEYYDENTDEYMQGNLTKADFARLYDLVMLECESSDLGMINSTDNNYEIAIRVTAEFCENGNYASSAYQFYSVDIPENAEQCIAFIRSLDLDEPVG